MKIKMHFQPFKKGYGTYMRWTMENVGIELKYNYLKKYSLLFIKNTLGILIFIFLFKFN